MPRPPRIHWPGGFYHVTLRGNHRRQIFFDDGDRHLLNRIVARAIEKFDSRLHAYCWMTNHVHLLIQIGAQPLGRPMRQIAAEYARAMQSKLDVTGHFFERRYGATLVDGDAYLLELLRYIHMNPVEAGIARSPAEYRWSSHHAYMNRRQEPWLTTDFALRIFAVERLRAIDAYQRFVSSATDWRPPEVSRGTAVIGSDDFMARIERSMAASRPRQGLDALIAEACTRFEVTAERLGSPVRDPYITKVRAWIAYQSAKRGIATLSAVARELGRDEATIRAAIRRYPNELE